MVEAAGNIILGLDEDGDPELTQSNPFGNFKAVANLMRIGCFNLERWQLALGLKKAFGCGSKVIRTAGRFVSFAILTASSTMMLR